MQTIAYGPATDQAGDLYLPQGDHVPLACLFHGGFWRMPYGRDQLEPMARDLVQAGLAIWNLGYRRVGPGGHPWPATLQDVEAALTFLPTLQQTHRCLDLSRLLLVGHSAGGHLAFWAALTARKLLPPGSPAAVVGLAPILDLEAAGSAGLGTGAVEEFLGGSSSAVPDRYLAASPAVQLPLGLRQYLLHGEEDTAVPPALSEAYVDRARALGDDVIHIPLPATGHMALIDPRSPAYRRVRQCVLTAV
jgi:acetyl esterase/lipase